MPVINRSKRSSELAACAVSPQAVSESAPGLAQKGDFADEFEPAASRCTGPSPHRAHAASSVQGAPTERLESEHCADETVDKQWPSGAPNVVLQMLEAPQNIANLLAERDDKEHLALLDVLTDKLEDTPVSFLPRRLVVLETMLRWCQKRDPCGSFFGAQLSETYRFVCPVQMRQRLAAALSLEQSGWVPQAYKQLLCRAKRFYRAQRMAKHNEFFLTGATFAAAHVALGAALSVASTIAWLLGNSACFEFCLAFFVCGLGIIVWWGGMYAMLWLYYRCAPW